MAYGSGSIAGLRFSVDGNLDRRDGFAQFRSQIGQGRHGWCRFPIPRTMAISNCGAISMLERKSVEFAVVPDFCTEIACVGHTASGNFKTGGG